MLEATFSHNSNLSDITDKDYSCYLSIHLAALVFISLASININKTYLTMSAIMYISLYSGSL